MQQCKASNKITSNTQLLKQSKSLHIAGSIKQMHP